MVLIGFVHVCSDTYIYRNATRRLTSNKPTGNEKEKCNYIMHVCVCVCVCVCMCVCVYVCVYVCVCVCLHRTSLVPI